MRYISSICKKTSWLLLGAILSVSFTGCDPGDLASLQTDANATGAPATTTTASGTLPGANGTASSGAAAANNPIGIPTSARNTTSQSQTLNGKSNQNIVIASFNIQVFGTEKLRNDWVMKHVVDIVRQFDVVAIQEIRSVDQTLIEQFISKINFDGSRYSYVIGPRLGRSNSKEQYAYVYDTRRVICLRERAYTVDDPADLLHREPFVAHFEVIPQGKYVPFTFTMINVHTDPDEVKAEMNALDEVYRSVRQYEFPEDDIIMVGDFNAAPRAFGDVALIPGIYPLIQNVFSNTRQTKLYDNIIVDQVSSQEFTGRAGVWNLQTHYKLQMADAEKISDHYPVWGEFTMYESGGMVPAMAQQPFGAATR